MPLVKDSRQRTSLFNSLVIGLAVLIVGFWAIELQWALEANDKDSAAFLDRYQKEQLSAKSEDLKDVFGNLYSTSRTLSLLPMLRSVKGKNRSSAQEDVVAKGRLSGDAHRSIQQIYRNLHQFLQVSEIYYVLDGFNPSAGEVPFFMYDDAIVGIAGSPGERSEQTDPAEVEEIEYAHYPKQLEWFRKNAPDFRYNKRLDDIPVRLSPLMRTCDNTQFLSEETGSIRDTEGFIYAMPVYDQEDGGLRGMITTVVRANVLEAKLIGVPVLPITPADKRELADLKIDFPEKPSPFYLRNRDYGIDLFDRRHTTIPEIVAGKSAKGGRTLELPLNLNTGRDWTIGHYLSQEEVTTLLKPLKLARQLTLAGRISLLIMLVAAFVWAGMLMRRSRNELLRMAHMDALTELPNRRAFFSRLESAMARSQRNERRVGLFFMDIAGFGAINDTLGQQHGDMLLAEVANRLQTCVRTYDLVARGGPDKRIPDSVSRLGGDEFTVLCEDLKDSDDLVVVADRIMEAMKEPIQLGHDVVEVSLYIGIASFPDDAGDGEKLLMSAESAMHECKKTGPGFRLFNEDMRLRAARQHHLMVELQLALERNQFQVFYQPKKQLSNGQIVSLEALIRWRHPDVGMISPTEFIPLLERSGHILEVGEWVLRRSCEDLIRLTAHGHERLRVSVNVSVRQLRRGDFVHTVQRVLDDTKLDPDRLILEITESMVMENIDDGRRTLEELAALGVRLAIDDFGTGYSSLTYLQHLPLDYLKLDKSFIDGMVNDRARHIVRSVILLSQGLSLQTIAEGIEQAEQARELSDLGCDMIQGYLLSRPIPYDEIVTWLHRHELTRQH